ncbi:hypothetical protein MLD38_025443 [Melastoma candidum]|uniref:Uncharacterized protein n=1 Tax=Melastoma candidum TaxID=119954 RepID=A0ACB9NVU7_9MYRT|nr:hypothetical protein MLD38_025443 [Melastoma candidum]
MAFWLVSSASQVLAQNCCDITSIYQLGDSHTDIGNFIRLSGPASPYSFAARPPYGETLGKLTSRHSDGLLIVDYFAKALQLPLVNPYLAKDVSFENGIVFSVAGCTALSTLLLTVKGIVSPMIPNFPLKNQLFWFRRYLASICKSPAVCRKVEDIGRVHCAFKSVLKNAASLSFNPNSTLKTCCGKGGAYNFDLTTICGTLTYEVCPSPNEYISWDGIHMTQRGYYHMAQYLIREILPQLSCPVNEPAN